MATVIASLGGALISAAAAIIVCVLTNRVQMKKFQMEMAERDKQFRIDQEKRDALQVYRLEQLEKKVDKHNQVVERTYMLEQGTAVLSEQMKVANHRIADLETITRSDQK